jgi:hypothetical protein
MTYDARLQRDVELTAWETPDYYGGFSPVGDYIIYARNRDSCILENSNYERILSDLKDLSNELGCNDDTQIYDFRAGHWGCGWVEYILIPKDAPVNLILAGESIVKGLQDYCIYDESDYSEKETEAINDYWRDLSLRERMDIILKYRREDTTMFAARYDHAPSDLGINEYLREGL